MAKIMLIKPPMYADAVFDPIRTAQPLGLWYIGSYLKEKGHNVSIVDSVSQGINNRLLINSRKNYQQFLEDKVNDLNILTEEEFVSKYSPHNEGEEVSRTVVRIGLSNDDILKRIKNENPESIGISLFATCNHLSGIDLAKQIKKRFPRIKIIAGGAHATDMSKRVLNDSEGSIDYCVRGDGQFVMEELVNGKIPQTGVAFFDNGKFIDNGEYRRLCMNDFSLLDPKLLENIVMPTPASHTFDTKNRKYVDIMFSRGCSKKCEYCVAGSKNYQYNGMSLDKVEEQLKLLKNSGFEELIFQDDDLLRDQNHFIEVLELVKQYEFKWQDNGGIAIENLNQTVANAILENGNCNSLYVPVNPRNYKVHRAAGIATNRYHENIDQLKRLRNNGIYVYTSGIFGNDVQTKEDTDSEIEVYKTLIKEGYVDQALVFAVSHLPGTKNNLLFNKDIVNPDDWFGYSIFVPHARTKTMSIYDVEVAIVKANKEFNKLQRRTGSWGSAFPSI